MNTIKLNLPAGVLVQADGNHSQAFNCPGTYTVSSNSDAITVTITHLDRR